MPKVIPAMGFGTFTVMDPNTIINALRIGYRHLDLAVNYENLGHVAKALRYAFDSVESGGLGLKREDLWITMKTLDCSPQYIDHLLEVLRITYFDLLLIHFPQRFFRDEETLTQAWSELSNQVPGKLKHIGVSNCYEGHLSRLLAVCDKGHFEKPYANEIESSLFARTPNIVDMCKTHDIKVIAYSPLGFLNARFLLDQEPLTTLSKHLRISPSQIMLAFLLLQNIAVIPKSSSLEHLQENFDSLRLVTELSEDQQLSIRKLEEKIENLGHLLEDAERAEKHGASLSWEVLASNLGMSL